MITFFRFTFLFLIIFLFSSKIEAQIFVGDWYCAYATWDEQPNATGYSTPSVAVLGEDTFVALAIRPPTATTAGANYLVGYTNADSMNGRLGSYGLGGQMQGVYQQWVSGFDLIEFFGAYDIAAGPDGKIYVANNDEERNILVFDLSLDDSVQIGVTTTQVPVYSYLISAPYRLSTGTDPIWSVATDDIGYVYVTVLGDEETPGKVLVFEGPNLDDNWGILHNSEPITVVEMTEPGFIRGVAVKGDGTLLYISNYTNNNIYCYIGSPVDGYTRYEGFNFVLDEIFIHPDGDTLYPGPLGMAYLEENNVLFVASSQIFTMGAGYKYNRIHALNPNNGDELNYIDPAEWNFAHFGSYSSRPGGTYGVASGYASTYNIDFDEAKNLYAASYWSWSIDKWVFTGVIPTIPITILSVESNDNILPTKFGLNQNYPNPFNPATTIEFSIIEDANVKLTIYSLTGELVADLINTELSKGSYKYTFDASKLASGTYIYTLTNGVNQLSRKMTLLK